MQLFNVPVHVHLTKDYISFYGSARHICNLSVLVLENPAITFYEMSV